MDDDQAMTRIQAAEYLTSKGRPTKVSTLAKYAGDGRGPMSHKDHRQVLYWQADLDAWLAKPKSMSGPKPRANGRARPVATDLPSKIVDLRALLLEHIELADLFASRNGDAYIGFQFARSLDKLRRLVS